jgi:hypothetical protein
VVYGNGWGSFQDRKYAPGFGLEYAVRISGRGLGLWSMVMGGGRFRTEIMRQGLAWSMQSEFRERLGSVVYGKGLGYISDL